MQSKIKTNILLLLISVLFVPTFSDASCLKLKNYALKWTAFKTPLKKGVSGTFDKIDIQLKKLTKSGANQFNNEINLFVKSVNSSNKKRDKNLTTAFFDKFSGSSQIHVKILNSKKNVLFTSIKMNNKTINVPFSYTFSKNHLKASGVIDLFDFSLFKPLKSLNKKCSKAHQNKTWSDVSIEFSADFVAC